MNPKCTLLFIYMVSNLATSFKVRYWPNDYKRSESTRPCIGVPYVIDKKRFYENKVFTETMYAVLNCGRRDTDNAEHCGHPNDNIKINKIIFSVRQMKVY